MSQDSLTKKLIKKSSVDSPKEQLRNAWLSLGETLQKIIQLQRSLAGLSVQEQTSVGVLLQKLRIYQDAMPELVDAFERLGPTYASETFLVPSGGSVIARSFSSIAGFSSG